MIPRSASWIPIALAAALVLVLAQEEARAQAYPVQKSPNGRYLVDQNNAPFLVAGDAPQSLTVNLSTADADFYLADRAAHGFNSVWINLICTTYTAGQADGSTYDGILPFTAHLSGGTTVDDYDLTKPNEAFFARCDQMLALAANHGLLVFLDPIETGGWLTCMNNNGTTACRAYGQYLGNRYKNQKNILWMSGNDYQDFGPTYDPVVTSVALGIKDNDPNHLHTVELKYDISNSIDDPAWVPLIGLNASYTYSPAYAEVLAAYAANLMPVFMVECVYEYESNAQTHQSTPLTLRRTEYWTNLSGATGQLYGNHYTWTFTSGWKSFLDSPGALQMPHVKALFEPRAWYNLVPDDHSAPKILTAGAGTYTTTGEVDANDYAAAARTPDGSLIMVYIPTLRTLSVAMTQLGGAANARWYDPANGTFTAVAGAPFSNAGTRSFTPPGNNSEGSPDWVLVLETTTPPPPPTISSPPANQSVTAGQTATFLVTATGSGTLTYQWRKNGSAIAGATSASYTTPPTTLADSGSTYLCVVSNAGGSTPSASATLTVTAGGGGGLPSPWADLDIGSPGVAGSGSASGGTFTGQGGGADIWGTSDQFNFIYQTLTGDADIVARVSGLGNTNAWAKAGVMIRESLNADSSYAFTAITPSNGAVFQHRSGTGASAASDQGPMVVVPQWVRLIRSGNMFSSYVSADGTAWTPIGTPIPLSMATTVEIGFAVTSHDNTVTTTAPFDHLEGTGGWQSGGVTPSPVPPPSGGGGGSPSGGGGGGGGGGGCGLTGWEVLLCLGAARLRRGPRRT